MKTKTRKMSWEERDALQSMIRAVPPVIRGSGPATSVWMVTGDLEPTQCVDEARWIMTDSQMDCHIVQIDAAGDAIVIVEE